MCVAQLKKYLKPHNIKYLLWIKAKQNKAKKKAKAKVIRNELICIIFWNDMNKMILIYSQEKAGLEKVVESLQTNLEKVTRESQTNLDDQLRVISFITSIQNIQNTNDFTPLQENEKIHQKHLALQKEYSILKKRAEEMDRVRIIRFWFIWFHLNNLSISYICTDISTPMRKISIVCYFLIFCIGVPMS